jgi:hypothetical protein
MSKDELNMNDTYTDIHNPIFKAMQELNTRWRHIHFIKERTSPTLQAFGNKTHNITQEEGIQHTTSSKYINQ